MDNFILKLATFSASAQQLPSFESLPTISRTRVAPLFGSPLSRQVFSSLYVPNRPARAFVPLDKVKLGFATSKIEKPSFLLPTPCLARQSSLKSNFVVSIFLS